MKLLLYHRWNYHLLVIAFVLKTMVTLKIAHGISFTEICSIIMMLYNILLHY